MNFKSIACGVRGALVTMSLLAVAGAVRAQISISAADVALTENFDGLPSSGTSTWTSNGTLTGVYAGGDAQITTAYRNGVNEKTSFGINYTNPESDRALGMSLLDNINSDTVWYGFRYVNDTGATLYSLEISYYVERYYGWEDTNTRFDEGFRVYTAVDPSTTGNPSGVEWERREALEFHPDAGSVAGSMGPAALASGIYYFDGNNADYRTLVSGLLNISGGLAAGHEYWIMFGNTVVGAGAKTNADGVAIDDLSVTFSTVAIPEPSAFVALAGLCVLGAATARRRALR